MSTAMYLLEAVSTAAATVAPTQEVALPAQEAVNGACDFDTNADRVANTTIAIGVGAMTFLVGGKAYIQYAAGKPKRKLVGEEGKPLKDEYGRPIYEADEPKIGEDDKVLWGEDGKQVFKKEPAFKKNGKPVIGKDGKPVYTNEPIIGTGEPAIRKGKLKIKNGKLVRGEDGEPTREHDEQILIGSGFSGEAIAGRQAEAKKRRKVYAVAAPVGMLATWLTYLQLDGVC